MTSRGGLDEVWVPSINDSDNNSDSDPDSNSDSETESPIRKTGCMYTQLPEFADPACKALLDNCTVREKRRIMSDA